jgi:hypothetical protein
MSIRRPTLLDYLRMRIRPTHPLGSVRNQREAAPAENRAQLDSFRSHYKLRRPPRGPEARAAVIHMAVSMFEAPEPCWPLIDRTRGRIGDRVAALRLIPGRGVCVAKTGGPLHWSVWGDPAVLQAAIADYLNR